uniref:Uncharacterized protein n=1 Tax=Timema bartmani TaxID=61472 RepID=A0A7R9F8C9_9NEOP|nr:unnamed protein product [Timema bartmani]
MTAPFPNNNHADPPEIISTVVITSSATRRAFGRFNARDLLEEDVLLLCLKWKCISLSSATRRAFGRFNARDLLEEDVLLLCLEWKCNPLSSATCRAFGRFNARDLLEEDVLLLRLEWKCTPLSIATCRLVRLSLLLEEDVLQQLLGDDPVRSGRILPGCPVQSGVDNVQRLAQVATHVEPPVAHEHRLEHTEGLFSDLPAGASYQHPVGVPGIPVRTGCRWDTGRWPVVRRCRSSARPDSDSPCRQRSPGKAARRSRSWCRAQRPARGSPSQVDLEQFGDILNHPRLSGFERLQWISSLRQAGWLLLGYSIPGIDFPSSKHSRRLLPGIDFPSSKYSRSWDDGIGVHMFGADVPFADCHRVIAGSKGSQTRKHQGVVGHWRVLVAALTDNMMFVLKATSWRASYLYRQRCCHLGLHVVISLLDLSSLDEDFVFLKSRQQFEGLLGHAVVSGDVYLQVLNSRALCVNCPVQRRP